MTPETISGIAWGACQMGGDVIQWVMKTRGVNFRHAVELLRADHPSLAAELSSGKAGHVVRKGTTAKLDAPVSADAGDHETLLSVVQFYRRTLKESPEALRYLDSRVLTHPEMISASSWGSPT